MRAPVKFKDRIMEGFNRLAGKRKVRRGLAAFVFFVALTLLIAVDFMPQKVNLVVGQVSPQDIDAPRSIIFEDADKTEEARDQAEAGIEMQYIVDPRVGVDVQQDMAELVESIEIVQNEELEDEQKTERLKEQIPFNLPADVIKSLAAPDPENLDRLESGLIAMVARVMGSEEGVL
ncbi:MAG: phosphohydrolase, partial [Firmicutes bacterium]|nr:phosphohydrolase [Bacillota bacterium]